MLIKRLIGLGTIMMLLGAGSTAFAQDGGAMTPDAVSPDGGADAGPEPDAVNPPPPTGAGYQDCTDDMDCEDLAANEDVIIRCEEFEDPNDPTGNSTFRFCRVQVDDSSERVEDSSPIDGVDNELGDPCEDDTDCDNGRDGYPVGTFSQCDSSFLRCRPIDQGAIGCMADDDCPRNEDCSNELCQNRATDRSSSATGSEVPCGREDNCGKARGVGCSVSPEASPFASTGLGLLAALGMLLVARRRRRD